VALAACQGRRDPEPGPPREVAAGPGDRPWYAGTPKMQRDIRDLIARIPQTAGADRIALGRQLVGYGEPAVPQLVDALQHPDADTRGTAAWLLGMMADPRVSDALSRATRDGERLVRYEAGTALLRLGDDRGLGTVIDGLEDEDPRIRSKSILVLQDRTGDTFGFEPSGGPLDREAAVKRWRVWAERQTGRRR
jgi:bilin biosynthesis protein